MTTALAATEQTTTDYAAAVEAINATPPLNLVVMMYDEIIVSISEAILCIERNDIEGRWNALKRALDYLFELYGSLDMEGGGEVAENLSKLYGFFRRQILKVNLNNDAKSAESMLVMIVELRNAWSEVAAKNAPAAETQAVS